MADLASFFEIEAVEVGRREADSSTFLLHTDIGTTIKLVYRFWLLRGPDGITIVDTGVEENEARKRGTHGITPITRALSERGVDPENVQNVILTHLHWDQGCSVFHLVRNNPYSSIFCAGRPYPRAMSANWTTA